MNFMYVFDHNVGEAMKNNTLIYYLALTVLFIFGCSDSTSNSKKENDMFIRLTLNGGQYDNETFEFDNLMPPSTEAHFNDSLNSTEIFIMNSINSDDLFWVNMEFPGCETGGFASDSAYILRSTYISISFISRMESFFGTQYTININNYGEIGEYISGSFDGNFIIRSTLIDTNNLSFDNVEINGSFSVIRQEDNFDIIDYMNGRRY